MNQQEQANYNKLAQELDEVKGDLIDAKREVERLTPLNTRLNKRCGELWDYIQEEQPKKFNWWFALVCCITASSLIVNYQQRQELLFWQCPPTYQTPPSPTPLEE